MGILRDGALVVAGAILGATTFATLVYSPDLRFRVRDSIDGTVRKVVYEATASDQQKQCDAKLKDYAESIQQQASFRPCPLNRLTFDPLCTPKELSRIDDQYRVLSDRTYNLERAIRSQNCFDLDGFSDAYLQANSFL